MFFFFDKNKYFTVKIICCFIITVILYFYIPLNKIFDKNIKDTKNNLY